MSATRWFALDCAACAAAIMVTCAVSIHSDAWVWFVGFAWQSYAWTSYRLGKAVR